MKALVCRAAGEIEFVDAPAPAPAPGESLIKVDSCGVCGSDMHAFLGHDERRPPPLILGHEAAGEVVGGEKLGARVAVNRWSFAIFKSARAVRDVRGGARQLVRAAADFVDAAAAGRVRRIRVRAGRQFIRIAAVFSVRQSRAFEPLACGRRAARLAAELSPTALEKCETLVIGGGAIGLGCALFLARAGAARVAIIEANPLRQKTLSRATAFAGIDVAAPGDSARSAQCRRRCGRQRRQPRSRVWACRRGRLIAHIGLGGGAGGVDSRRLTLQEIVFAALTHTPKGLRRNGARLLVRRIG